MRWVMRMGSPTGTTAGSGRSPTDRACVAGPGRSGRNWASGTVSQRGWRLGGSYPEEPRERYGARRRPGLHGVQKPTLAHPRGPSSDPAKMLSGTPCRIVAQRGDGIRNRSRWSEVGLVDFEQRLVYLNHHSSLCSMPTPFSPSNSKADASAYVTAAAPDQPRSTRRCIVPERNSLVTVANQ
jgi:hypothetical protein